MEIPHGIWSVVEHSGENEEERKREKKATGKSTPPPPSTDGFLRLPPAAAR
jgi:hypothetical protein